MASSSPGAGSQTGGDRPWALPGVAGGTNNNSDSGDHSLAGSSSDHGAGHMLTQDEWYELQVRDHEETVALKQQQRGGGTPPPPPPQLTTEEMSPMSALLAARNSILPAAAVAQSAPAAAPSQMRFHESSTGAAQSSLAAAEGMGSPAASTSSSKRGDRVFALAEEDRSRSQRVDEMAHLEKTLTSDMDQARQFLSGWGATELKKTAAMGGDGQLEQQQASDLTSSILVQQQYPKPAPHGTGGGGHEASAEKKKHAPPRAPHRHLASGEHAHEPSAEKRKHAPPPPPHKHVQLQGAPPPPPHNGHLAHHHPSIYENSFGEHPHPPPPVPRAAAPAAANQRKPAVVGKLSQAGNLRLRMNMSFIMLVLKKWQRPLLIRAFNTLQFHRTSAMSY